MAVPHGHSTFLPVPEGAVGALAAIGTLKVRKTLNTDLLLNRSDKNLKRAVSALFFTVLEKISNFPAPASSELVPADPDGLSLLLPRSSPHSMPNNRKRSSRLNFAKVLNVYENVFSSIVRNTHLP